MKDISFNVDDSKFNYRVGAIIKNGTKILVHKDVRDTHITIPGGRVQLRESSFDALKREIKEEMNLDIIYKKDVAILENFFPADDKYYHELLFVYEVELADPKAYDLSEIKAVEDEKKDILSFKWVEISELLENNFKPTVLTNFMDDDIHELQHLSIIE